MASPATAPRTGPSLAVERRPLTTPLALLAVLVCAAVSVGALEWDFSALASSAERAKALARLTSFLGSFGAPDLSSEVLAQGVSLSVQTLATAFWGTALGLALGYGIALFASRAVILGDEPRPSLRRPADALRLASYGARRALLELARLLLDVLRGVPDFAWALLILTVPGPGPITGALALALNIGGIVGKIYSELWDSVDPRRYQALRSTGSSRAAVFLFGIQPLAAPSMLSFALMRAECAIRNASVIGVVGGGGLGAQFFEELQYGHYGVVVTLLLFMLALTASTDLLSNFLRHQLRSDPNHTRVPRGLGLRASLLKRSCALGAVTLLLVLCAWRLLPAWRRALAELDRIEWPWIRQEFSRFVHPDLSWPAVSQAVSSARVPLAMAVLATLGAVLVAGLLVYPGSVAFQLEPQRFTGERVGWLRRGARTLLVLAIRMLALVFRSLPEVAWLLLFAAFLRMGVLAGLLALMVHSSGVLARVFVESVDNVPYRRYEQTFLGSRPATFLYAALPSSAREWLTYSFFQFESNVRTGVMLGIIGVGGLGDRFHSAYEGMRDWNRAGTYLLAMILFTTLIDRTARAFRLEPLLR
jgi:phosphonate transport system permease protein